MPLPAAAPQGDFRPLGNVSDPFAEMDEKTILRLRVRMLPYLVSKLHPGYSLAKCNFKVQKSKMSTARVVACRTLGLAGSYTLEASLGGASHSRWAARPARVLAAY